MAKILAFAGSARRDSSNKKLVHLAADSARTAGAEVTLIDLADFRMPIYDGDVEESQGLPEASVRLYAMMKAHAGLLLACPEYNSSVTPLLKNTIDWLSRPRPGDAPLAAFGGKVAALISASPGALGGLRGLVHVRAILQNIGVLVVPNQLAVPKAPEAFDEAGKLRDGDTAGRLDNVTRQLVETARRLN